MQTMCGFFYEKNFDSKSWEESLLYQQTYMDSPCQHIARMGTADPWSQQLLAVGWFSFYKGRARSGFSSEYVHTTLQS